VKCHGELLAVAVNSKLSDSDGVSSCGVLTQ
jgi:hypothetical protein